MDKLARGIDPITDQPLPGDTALNQGFLKKRTTQYRKNTRVTTPSGQSIGLTSETRQGREGEYQMVLYDLGAQQFVLDHLPEMMI